MIETTSGSIYKFQMEFGLGWAFAELLDYSDESEFDGKLLQVFNVIDTEKTQNLRSIEEIKDSGVLLGPAPVNKYPNIKGKNAWILYGRDEKYSTDTIVSKKLRALLVKNNWADLKPWFKQYPFQPKLQPIECDYEEVRHLETMILNHPDTIRIKATMMKLIGKGEKINSYYDLKDMGNKNLFLQVVNTYYEKEIADELLSQI